MSNWRSVQHTIDTFLQARRGLPSPTVAAKSVMFFAMFVAAVAGMTYGLVWLPRGAGETRMFWQAIASAIGAALVTFIILFLLQRRLGFRIVAIAADFMMGTLLGIALWGLLTAIFRGQLPDWSALAIIGSGLLMVVAGGIVGRGISPPKTNQAPG